MNDKPVLARPLATQDVEGAVKYYRSAMTEAQSQRFVDALEDAYRHIGRLPATGSPRYGHQLGIAGLRTWPVRGFPFLVLYAEKEFTIDIYRVLHVSRDMPASLIEDMEE